MKQKHISTIYECVVCSKMANIPVEFQSYYRRNHIDDKTSRDNLEYNNSVNFKKGPEKTENLFKMLKSLAYVYHDREKRDKLIDFTSKFQLNRESLRNWVLAYLVILK